MSFVYMYVWEPCAYQVPAEVRSGRWISLQLEQHVFLTAEPASQLRIFEYLRCNYTCLASALSGLPVFESCPITVLAMFYLFCYWEAPQVLFSAPHL